MQRIKKNEVGRSMVEILGVLAVIGILSIGGIQGYKYAMDKWRANTTLQDVNVRMIDVVRQVLQGQMNIHIPSDWANRGRAGYLIELFQDVELEPFIMVKQVEPNVCKIMIETAMNTSDIFVGLINSEDIDGDWYLGDNKNICDNGNKDMLFALNEDLFEQIGNDNTNDNKCESKVDCSANKPYCEKGTCVQCLQDEHCPQKLPYCDDKTHMCQKACSTNKDCDKNQFCADSGESNQVASPFMCKNLNFREIKIDNISYYVSNEPMNWWDAKSACNALDNRNLLPMNDLMTESDGSAWKGDTGRHTKKELLKSLHNKIWNGQGWPWMWTSNTNGFTKAYGIGINGGNIYSVNRKDNSYFIYGNDYYLYVICR